MATIKQMIDAAYAVYMQSYDKGELEGALSSLCELLGDGPYARLINDVNRENAQFLSIKTELKIAAVVYFCEGYEHADFLALEAFCKEADGRCRELGFTKTGLLVESVLSAAREADKTLSEAVSLKLRVFDPEGSCIAEDAEVCRAVSREAQQMIETAKAFSMPSAIFVDGSAFPDVKAQIIGDLAEFNAQVLRAAESFNKIQVDEILRCGAEDITASLNAKAFKYYPSYSNVEKLAKCIVLCTPFPAEAEILAWSCANGAPIVRLNALSFEGAEKDAAEGVFDALRKRGADVIVYGMAHYRDKARDNFYRAAMNFSKSGRRSYIVADDGTRRIYDEACAAATGGLSPIDVSFLYLSMPDYAQTIEELRNLKMIDDAPERALEIRQKMPFMGFAGLNSVVATYGAGGDWIAVGEAISRDNYPAAEAYMLKLSRQGLFIDGGWGNYHEDIAILKGKRFDYDDVKIVNPDNVRKIVEGNFSIFVKCGLIVTYCLLAGQSAKDWETLEDEIRIERVSEATKLVMRMLGVNIVPKIEIVEKASYNGQCCQGGKLVKYNRARLKDYEGVSNTICHECYHAFQWYAVNEGWQEWYYTELGVTRGTIDELTFNENNYQNIDKVGYTIYAVQLMESGARAFASDCCKYGAVAEAYHLLNLD